MFDVQNRIAGHLLSPLRRHRAFRFRRYRAIFASLPLIVWFLSAGVAAAGSAKPRVVVLGDSLSAGYGIDPDQAYPALLQERIEQAGMDATVVNAGVSGDTTAGGLRRVGWLLKQPVDILILELGANDGLRGVPLKETERNLREIIRTVKSRYPDVHVVLAGMKLPLNLGPDYTRRFEAIFSNLAREEKTHLIPFLLEGVAGRPDLNLPDGIHPTPAGHRKMAETVWQVVRPLLEEG